MDRIEVAALGEVHDFLARRPSGRSSSCSKVEIVASEVVEAPEGGVVQEGPIDVSTAPGELAPSPFTTPVGGRLRFHAQSWREVTDDEWVLQVVSHGYYPQFISRPPLLSPPPHWMVPAHPAEVQREVDVLLAKGAVARSSDPSAPGFYSPLFVVPKKTGGSR